MNWSTAWGSAGRSAARQCGIGRSAASACSISGASPLPGLLGHDPPQDVPVGEELVEHARPVPGNPGGQNVPLPGGGRQGHTLQRGEGLSQDVERIPVLNTIRPRASQPRPLQHEALKGLTGHRPDGPAGGVERTTAHTAEDGRRHPGSAGRVRQGHLAFRGRWGRLALKARQIRRGRRYTADAQDRVLRPQLLQRVLHESRPHPEALGEPRRGERGARARAAQDELGQRAASALGAPDPRSRTSTRGHAAVSTGTGRHATA